MPIKALNIRPGVNKDNTRSDVEGGWYDSDKVRFRSGKPEKIGGWEQISANTFTGICRSMWSWLTLGSSSVTGLGTHLKFFIEQGGAYYDITPIRATASLTDPFDTSSGLSTVTVTDVAHGASPGDYVTFSGASAVGGLTIDGEYALTYIDDDTYTIDAGSNASSTATGGGSVTAAYQISVGSDIARPITGWGAGVWSSGTWGNSGTTNQPIRLWSQRNFGEDLVFGPRDAGMYYWDSSSGVGTRGVALSSLPGASDVPTVQSFIFVSDVSRFVFAFGANEIGSSTQDRTLIRWSDQEDAANWTPAATNQAGSLKLSSGSEIVTVAQSRQEILVWTNTALYSLQYQQPPIVWGATLLGERTSIISPNAAVFADRLAFWMGKDKFFKYDGTVTTLPCPLHRYIFGDINYAQTAQVFCGALSKFDEVWWFWCSDGETAIDRYAIYNYVDNVWSHGTMARTAWSDSGTKLYPRAATYSYNIVNHEYGVDDNASGTPAAISAYIESGRIDLEDGDRFMMVNKVLPDITFDGSSAASPAATFYLYPAANPGSVYNDPDSEGGVNSATTTRTASAPVEAYTEQLDLRVRGRQLVLRVESTAEGVAWQLGTPRVNMRPSGRRGN